MDGTNEPLSDPAKSRTDPGPVGTVASPGGGRGMERRPFRLQSPWREFFQRHRWAAVVGSVASVLLLLLSGVPATFPTPSSHLSTDSLPGPTPAPPTYYPYLENPSAYPSPDLLPNESGPVSLPQLSTQILGSVPVYDLAFATTTPGVGTVLETQTGAYNASLAQGIFTSGFCASRCSHHLPILWNTPVPVAAYGSATIQGLALGTTSTWVVLAAAANNQTAVYFSPNLAGNGSWYSLTGKTLVQGASPRLAVSPCDALLTTLTSTNLIATQFNLPCGQAWSPPPPPPTPPQPGGGLGRQSPGGGPTVVAVIPSRDAAGNTTLVNGTNFNSVSAVLFNGVPSPSFSVTVPSIQLAAVIPSGAGTVDVQVVAGGQQSPLSCADQFTYGTVLAPGTPEVTRVSPAAAPAGSTVDIYGVYFQSTSGVKFGTLTATGVKLVAPGELSATVPLGTGTVDVTVTNTVGTSPTGCGDRFTIQAIPSVISVTPDQGPSGTSTTILGTNFLTSATVKFGSTAATSVRYYNSNELLATAPTGNGTVNVTVHQSSYTSALSCADEFTYGTAPPVGAPQVEYLLPTANASFGSVAIYGYNFQTGATAYFGGVPTPRVYYETSSVLQVEVPLGIGTVPVQVAESAGASLPTCADDFTIQLPNALANFTKTSWTLPRALAADPDYVGGNPYTGLNGLPGSGEAPVILASNASNSEVVLYQWNGSGSGKWVPTNLAPFASFNASSPANQLGGTSLSVTNGTSGQVAITSYGQGVFALFTTYLNGETVPETMGSADGGAHWGGPYATSPGVASVRDPEAAVSPAGYVYVTWRDNGAGPWQVDQAVFWPSGVSLVAPQPLPASGGGGLLSAGAPSLAIDGFGRPLYAWSVTFPGPSSNTTVLAGPAASVPDSVIEYSGDFASAYSALQAVHQGFNHTVPADFENFGGPGLSAFRYSVNSTMLNLTADVTNVAKLCPSQTIAFGSLYPNVTENAPGPVLADPAPSCTLYEGLDNSIVANTSGPFSAGAYLQLETSNLLEALGVGTMPVPDWVTALYSPGPPLRGGDFVPGKPAAYTGSHGTRVEVDPVALNPNSIWLNASGVFWTQYASTDNNHTSGSTTTVCGTNATSDAPVLFSTNLTVKNQAGSTTAQGTYNSTTQPSDIYVTHLRALRNGTWTEKLKVVYQYTAHSTTSCPASYGFVNGTWNLPPPAGWPKTVTITLSGTYTTGLSFYPDNVTVNSTGVNGNKNAMDDTVAWQNTVWAVADAWLNYSGNHSNLATWSNGTYQAPEYVSGHGFQAVPVGQNFTLAAKIQTKNGSANSAWWPALNGNQVSVAQPVETQSYSCSFTQLGNYQQLWWYSSSNITAITADSATITWFSNGNNSGWVDYEDPYGTEFNQTAMVNTTSNHTYQYTVELHGLEPWSVYTLTAHVRTVHQCAVYQNQTTRWSFQTQAVILMAEQDQPYDSITGEGEGARLYFQVPTSFAAWSTFDNGTLTYYPVSNTSAAVTILLTTLPPEIWSSFPDGLGSAYVETTYEINITALTPDLIYNVSLSLNFTSVGNTTVRASSAAFQFWYLKDSSGDGLADSEKALGWNVTTLAPPWNGGKAVYSTAHRAAVPALYATNGLVSDYVEKDFALNPTVIDSASSHMLDTWNLTFNLPGHGPSCPSYFECWYENTTNPFTNASYPGGPATGVAAFLNNTTGPHTLIDDSSAYDATGIWSSSRISYLQGLVKNESEGWLRAVVGYYAPAHDWTLTVEGKLSWGANPLAQSTPGDGIPDGARVNPLGRTFVNVTVASWNDSGVGNGDGVAAFINATSNSVGYSGYQTDYSGYTQQVTAGAYGGGGRSLYGGNLGMSYTFPVLDNEQYAHLNVSLVQNSGGTISNAANLGPINIDLANTSRHPACVSCSGLSPSLSITYQVLTIYSKAPTFILVPSDNSTLSGLPLGLQRYTGEQNFALLVVNDTDPLSSDRTFSGINYVLPNGTTSSGTYSVTLAQGLNNILVPRALLFNTPLGQDLLNATEVNISGSNLNADLYYNATQWYDRVTGGVYNGYNYTGTPGFVKVYANNTTVGCSGSLCGGVPSNPNLEANHASLAIQAILALNISSQGALEDLLAGLLLNSSGSFTSWLFGATQYLPSLGLAPTVDDALANSVRYSAGSYDAPQSSQHASGFWDTVGADIWNAISGVVGALEVAWNAIVAAAAFFLYLETEAANWWLGALHQVASAFRHVASIIESALAAALQWVWDRVTSIFTDALRTLTDSFNQAIHDWMSLLYAAGNDTLAAYEGTNVAANMAAAAEQIGLAIAVPVLLAAAAGIAIDVLLGITMPFDIGPSTIAGFLIPILVLLLASKLQGTGGGGWPGELFSFIEGGVSTALTGMSSAAEWLFNQTQSLTSSAASDMIAPNFSPPGDAWALAAAIVGGAGTGAGVEVLDALNAALPTRIVPWSPAPQPAEAVADAGESVAYAVISLVLVLAEYLVSLLAPASGPLADAAFVAEMLLGIFGTIFAGVAAISALRGVLDPNPAVREIVGLTGWVGVGLSIGAAGAGVFDVYTLALAGPP